MELSSERVKPGVTSTAKQFIICHFTVKEGFWDEIPKNLQAYSWERRKAFSKCSSLCWNSCFLAGKRFNQTAEWRPALPSCLLYSFVFLSCLRLTQWSPRPLSTLIPWEWTQLCSGPFNHCPLSAHECILLPSVVNPIYLLHHVVSVPYELFAQISQGPARREESRSKSLPQHNTQKRTSSNT